jgi:predicted RNA-binding protein YlxR (DUF448 family)
VTVSEGTEGGVDSQLAGRPVTGPPVAPAPRRAPVRTCVGCRGRGDRADLVRVVVVEGLLVPDLRARAVGRGAWLHPDPTCLDLAVRRRALPRALRVPGPLDDTAVRHGLERLARERSRRTAVRPSGPDPTGHEIEPSTHDREQART